MYANKFSWGDIATNSIELAFDSRKTIRNSYSKPAAKSYESTPKQIHTIFN